MFLQLKGLQNYRLGENSCLLVLSRKSGTQACKERHFFGPPNLRAHILVAPDAARMHSISFESPYSSG